MALLTYMLLAPIPFTLASLVGWAVVAGAGVALADRPPAVRAAAGAQGLRASHRLSAAMETAQGEQVAQVVLEGTELLAD